MSPAGSAHALCSPSGAARWMACPGSVVMEAGLPDKSSPEADDGSHTHALAAEALSSPMVMTDVASWRARFRSSDLAEAQRAYHDAVYEAVLGLRREGATVDLHVEEPLSLAPVTGEGHWGTPDALIVARWPDGAVLVWVLDLKTGYGEVDDASPQLPIYGLAAIDQYVDPMAEFKGLRTTIVQPRLRSKFETLEWSQEELADLGGRVASSAAIALKLYQDPAEMTLEHLVPGDKQCQWCKAAKAGACPAFNQWVHETVYGEVQAIDDEDAQPEAHDTWAGTREQWYDERLPLLMSRVDAVERWCDYIRSAVNERLQEGKPVPGWKLVQGRKGNRAWTDEAAVVVLARAAGADNDTIYGRPALKTPAALQKALVPALFEQLEQFITQAPGKPAVAPISDSRPPYSAANTEEVTDYSAPEM